ncbi:IS4 family transposase [Anaeromyxobacter sp. SG66]|uniref:IS4 family transposase n=1 Tax=Anaeromyxobacter sp. SG66 TaxID=2925410 RepID=UPI001F592467|nr:IS4 family transposase [Anaeromyxobacter sp. SG66]
MDIRGEVEGAEFGDKRLSARLVRLAELLAKAPDQSFPKTAGSDTALEATYRFFGNEAVTPAAILQPHIDATVARCAQALAVVVAHDTTELSFSTDREGLGRLSGDETHGFLGHFALAVAARTRAPLGVLGMATVFRERGTRTSAGVSARTRMSLPLEAKETGRWLELVQRVDAEVGRAAAVHVMDREADAYELLAALSAGKHRFIVRLQFDRAVDTTVGRGRISDALRGKRTLLTREVALSARSSKRRQDPPSRTKKHPPRRSRVATLSVTASAVTILRPVHLGTRGPAALRLNVVRVHEKNPGGGIDPIEWRLVTSEPIETTEDVAAVVDGYRARWVIEEYFRALKQGCAYEKRQLESKHALLNALAVFAPIAWQLLALRQLSRDDADLPADRILSPLKLTLLQRHPDVRLRAQPSIRDAMLAIAKLGGHIKNNGEPGWQVLGRGFEDLLLLERGAALALRM